MPIPFRQTRWFILVAALVVALLLPGCAAWEKQKKADEEEARGKSRIPSMTDPQQDPNFQAFVGRLRKAIAARDMQMIASMMEPDFGYRWDTPPPDGNVFQYWDENGIWPELNAVIGERFVPLGQFMVAPPQFAEAPETYQGYRAGIRMVNGAWKFTYFVPADPGTARAESR